MIYTLDSKGRGYRYKAKLKRSLKTLLQWLVETLLANVSWIHHPEKQTFTSCTKKQRLGFMFTKQQWIRTAQPSSTASGAGNGQSCQRVTEETFNNESGTWHCLLSTGVAVQASGHDHFVWKSTHSSVKSSSLRTMDRLISGLIKAGAALHRSTLGLPGLILTRTQHKCHKCHNGAIQIPVRK